MKLKYRVKRFLPTATLCEHIRVHKLCLLYQDSSQQVVLTKLLCSGGENTQMLSLSNSICTAMKKHSVTSKSLVIKNDLSKSKAIDAPNILRVQNIQ